MKIVCREKQWIKVPAEGKNYSVDLNVHVLNENDEIDAAYELMCACLDSDIQSAEGSGADYVSWINRIESGDSGYAALDGNGWVAHATREKVWFEGLYSQGEGGEVTFNQFKLAVETYVRYLADPQREPIEVEFPAQ